MLSMRMMVVGIGIGMGVAALAPARADNTPLKVKPGLWEVTSDSEHSGAPPIPPEALARMTPEQRQKFETAMKQSMGPQHHVIKRCYTQADINKGFEPDRMGQGRCSQKVTASTGTLREGSFSCTGNSGTSSGSYHFEVRSPEAVTGNWDVTMNGGGNSMKMKSAMQGRWLGADCGKVKD